MFIAYPAYFLFPIKKGIDVIETDLLRNLNNNNLENRYDEILSEVDEEYVEQQLGL